MTQRLERKGENIGMKRVNHLFRGRVNCTIKCVSEAEFPNENGGRNRGKYP